MVAARELCCGSLPPVQLFDDNDDKQFNGTLEDVFVDGGTLQLSTSIRSAAVSSACA